MGYNKEASDRKTQDTDITAIDTEQRQKMTREVMQKVDQFAFDWAMREHLLEDGDSEYLASQYQIIRDHLNIGKEALDFVLLKPDYEGMTASELEQSIWRKYDAFQKGLVHQAVVSEVSEP
jgi:hypothetical protein